MRRPVQPSGNSHLHPTSHGEAILREARRKARSFLDHQQQYRLGVLPIEQANPKTARLAETAQEDPEAAIRMLQAVDRDIEAVADRGFGSAEFGELLAAMQSALHQGGRICFSGCGATGRLSILLEASWRRFWQEIRSEHPDLAARLPDLEDRVVSIMTGGDYALVRSVENFEDYESFARRQVQEAHLGRGDILVAFTGTAETTSVLGTIWQAVDDGARTFLVFNTPGDVAARHIERARQVIEDPRIVKLCLNNGPMAVTGSTRMQSTSTQLLVVGSALEMALVAWLESRLGEPDLRQLSIIPRSPADHRRSFAGLMNDLTQPQAVTAMAGWIRYEEELYRRRGLVTYLADECLLDIFTDTTERSPTFMLPRFRSCDDTVSPPSWAFVKNPRLPTVEAWLKVLRRRPRCLAWDSRAYAEMDAPRSLQQNPPRLDADQMLKFSIGNEDDASRYRGKDDAAILVVMEDEAQRLATAGDPFRLAFSAGAAPFANRAALVLGAAPSPIDLASTTWHLPVRLHRSPLRLGDRLAAKLVLNTVSTLTAARLGRLVGNSMAYLDPTNKKLVDRGTRLVAEQTGVDYETACYALHEAMEELPHTIKPGEEAPSPVAVAIARLKNRIQMS